MTHRSTRSRTALVAGTLALAMATSACSTLTAEPEPEQLQPVRALDVAVGRQAEPVDVEVDGGTHGVRITYRRLTMEPGATSGLHCHHGQLIVVVERGEITHFADSYPGGVRVFRAGESIVAGSHEIHEGINLGQETAEVMITHLTPEGKPLTETDLSQCG